MGKKHNLCPICKSEYLQIEDCDVWIGYISFETYDGKEYEITCLSCEAYGEGPTIAEAISNMIPKKMEQLDAKI